MAFGAMRAAWTGRGGRLAAAAACAAAAGGAPSPARAEPRPTPPVARKQPHEIVTHGDRRVDEFYWMRNDERTEPEVLAHLDAENAYTAAVMKDTEPLQEQLFSEMRGRIQEADQTAPQLDGAFWYYSRTEEGQQYSVHCRRAARDPERVDVRTVMGEGDGNELVYLDENREAEGEDFYRVGGLDVSPDHTMVAFAEDRTGGEKYTLRIRSMWDGADLETPVPDTSGNFVWANDNVTLFYVKKDELDRPFQVWKHSLGTDPSKDELVFHERDDAFYVGLSKSRSDKAIFISSGSAITSETHFLDADAPAAPPQCLVPRATGVEYDVYHRGDHFFYVYQASACGRRAGRSGGLTKTTRTRSGRTRRSWWRPWPTRPP